MNTNLLVCDESMTLTMKYENDEISLSQYKIQANEILMLADFEDIPSASALTDWTIESSSGQVR